MTHAPVRDRGVELRGTAAVVRRFSPAPLRRGAVRTLRAWAELTVSSRVLPDFVVIGTKRGGTSTLYSHLRRHPQVALAFPRGSRFKGSYFFDRHHHLGVDWYRSWFPMRSSVERREERLGARVVVGEACPYYLAHPDVPARLAAVLPRARLVVLLREPASRAFSHYRSNRRRGLESSSFEHALAAEDERLARASVRMGTHPSGYAPEHEHLSYRTQGQYAALLAPWFARFPRDQVLVLRSEDLYEDVSGTVATVTDFLGLRPQEVVGPGRVNAAPPEPMPAAAARYLQDVFTEPNRDLAALLGRAPLWTR